MKDQIKGKAQEIKGKVTGDKSEEMKGKARQEWGHAKAKARDVRDDVKEGMDRDRTDEERERDERNYREPGPDTP